MALRSAEAKHQKANEVKCAHSVEVVWQEKLAMMNKIHEEVIVFSDICEESSKYWCGVTMEKQLEGHAEFKSLKLLFKKSIPAVFFHKYTNDMLQYSIIGTGTAVGENANNKEVFKTFHMELLQTSFCFLMQHEYYNHKVEELFQQVINAESTKSIRNIC